MYKIDYVSPWTSKPPKVDNLIMPQESSFDSSENSNFGGEKITVKILAPVETN